MLLGFGRMSMMLQSHFFSRVLWLRLCLRSSRNAYWYSRIDYEVSCDWFCRSALLVAEIFSQLGNDSEAKEMD